MESKTILKMIEEVSPDDAAKLDEIDARVWCWLEGHKYIGLHWGGLGVSGYGTIDVESYEDKSGTKKPVPFSSSPFKNYTRSRSSLKSIRPDSWVMSSCGREKAYAESDLERKFPFWKRFWFTFTQKDFSINQYNVCAYHEVEELAELHAIIQAIDYERKNK